MRKIIIISFILSLIVFAGKIQAQTAALKSDSEQSREYLQSKIDHCERIKRNGKAMTFTGIGLSAAGAALIVIPFIVFEGSGSAGGAIGGVIGMVLFIPGVIFAMGGTALLASGIPLWVVAKKKRKQYENLKNSRLFPFINVDPIKKAGHFGLRFSF